MSWGANVGSWRAIQVVLLLVLGLFSGLLQAGVFDRANPFGGSSVGAQPLAVDQAYQLHLEHLAPGRVDLVWQIEPGYYLYHARFQLQPAAGVKIVERRDASTQIKQDPVFGRVEVYHNEARLRLLVGRQSDSSNDQLTMVYQGCWEGGICYPPVTKTLSLGPLPPAAGLVWPKPSSAQAAPSDATTATGSISAEVPLSEQGYFAQLLQGHALVPILGAFFLAGLALSLTPCVFPMIPILSGLIAGHGRHTTTGRAFLLSLVYVLSMSLTYTLAGILVGLCGANIQVALQQPWVISLFAALFVVLALSMFGFYELQVPAWLQTRISGVSNRQPAGSVAGAVAMGVLSALLVGPCMAAPLAGALIYLGQTGDPLLGGVALFVLSLGMGVPLLLVGASAGRLLPRAGRWMEGVKSTFGVVLLLMAVWMLDRIVPTSVTMTLVGVILVVSAVYLNVFERLGEQASGWHRLWKGVGLVLLVYGAALLVGVLAGGNSIVYPLRGVLVANATQQGAPQLQFARVRSLSELTPMLEAAERVGKPVMLDFYADWCVSCKELDYVTFADAGVRKRLASFRLIRVDLTANDAAAQALIKRYQVLGPPLLTFYDRKGQLRPEMAMVGVIAPDQFLTQIRTL